MGKTFDRLHGIVWTYNGPEKMVLVISPETRNTMTNAERMYLRRVAEERNIEVAVDCTLPGDTAIFMNKRDYNSPLPMEEE